MDFIKNARKVVTPVTKTTGSFNLSLDKHRFYRFYIFRTDLTIDLLTENNPSSWNASHSSLKIARLILYNYKEETQKRENTVEKVSINQLRKIETPVIYFLEFLFRAFEVKCKKLQKLQKLRQISIYSSYNHVLDIISNWAVNALQVNKDSNQDFPLKLPRMVFTVLTKDNVHKKVNLMK